MERLRSRKRIKNSCHNTEATSFPFYPKRNGVSEKTEV